MELIVPYPCAMSKRKLLFRIILILLIYYYYLLILLHYSAEVQQHCFRRGLLGLFLYTLSTVVVVVVVYVKAT